MESKTRFRFSIDRGGTFTDVFCQITRNKADNGNGNKNVVRVLKLLSQDLSNYKDAPTEGIRRILNEELGTI